MDRTAWVLTVSGLAFAKGEFTGDWTDGWSEELAHYCMQDVRVTVKLYKQMIALELSNAAIDLEHRFAQLCQDMEQFGFAFDTRHARDLHARLTARQDELTAELTDKYGGWYEQDGPVVTPKRSAKYKTRPEVTEGCAYTKIKFVVLNPGSRQHIERVLRSEGWVPHRVHREQRPSQDRRAGSAQDCRQVPERQAVC